LIKIGGGRIDRLLTAHGVSRIREVK